METTNPNPAAGASFIITTAAAAAAATTTTNETEKESKVCHKCKQVKPLLEFAVDKSKRDGLKACCKNCYNLARRKTPPKYKDYGVAHNLDTKRNPEKNPYDHPLDLDLIGTPKNYTPLPHPVTPQDPPLGEWPGAQEARPNGMYYLHAIYANGKGKLRKAVCDNPACRRDHTQVSFALNYLDTLPDGRNFYVLLCIDCYSHVLGKNR